MLTGHSTGVMGEGNGGLVAEKVGGSPVTRAEDTGPAGGVERTRENGSSTSSGEEDVVMAEKPHPLRPEHHHPQSTHQLLPPRPVTVVEPRPVGRVLHPPIADNSETDSADEVGAGHIAATTDSNQPHNAIRNGSVGQVFDCLFFTPRFPST